MKKKNLSPNAFTLVELVVVATILVILTSLWFYSYVWNLQDSRDAARLSDISKLSSALTLSHQKRWAYPNPWNSFNITATGTIVASQWKLDETVALSTLDQLVTDPKLKTPYTYSMTTNKQEFQVSWTLENSDNPRAILKWKYKTVSINLLPTLILATDTTSTMEISENTWAGAWNRTLFVFDGWMNNVVSTFSGDNGPESNGTSFDNLLNDPLIEMYQNSDYRNCIEIREAGKSLGDGEYQIRDSSGVLTSTWCTSM